MPKWNMHCIYRNMCTSYKWSPSWIAYFVRCVFFFISFSFFFSLSLSVSVSQFGFRNLVEERKLKKKATHTTKIYKWEMKEQTTQKKNCKFVCIARNAHNRSRAHIRLHFSLLRPVNVMQKILLPLFFSLDKDRQR